MITYLGHGRVQGNQPWVWCLQLSGVQASVNTVRGPRVPVFVVSPFPPRTGRGVWTAVSSGVSGSMAVVVTCPTITTYYEL